ncbi:MAG: hypothetical protein ACRDTD_15245 [Pseudonocardiaceae bacterium]
MPRVSGTDGIRIEATIGERNKYDQLTELIPQALIGLCATLHAADAATRPKAAEQLAGGYWVAASCLSRRPLRLLGVTAVPSPQTYSPLGGPRSAHCRAETIHAAAPAGQAHRSQPLGQGVLTSGGYYLPQVLRPDGPGR